MAKLVFKPWVGKHYTKGINGKRVLVLGESHYCDDPKDAVLTMTSDIIRDLYDDDSEHEPYKNTYTKFERALKGRVVPFEEKQELWNSVAFYNYVQHPIDEARKAPTAEEFRTSEPLFFETLEELQPDCAIVWGKRLYGQLPNTGEQQADVVLDNGDKIETWGYKLSNGKVVKLLPIYHPSAAFEWTYWHQAIDKLIKE
ncbi:MULTISPECIES: uracil-DNA glycosylase family protein [unclassified Myroides]|uniref:uracil-DNA glycosylase family protein n=1 Tax=unclassified Myroides TaxID=2642485 RepID=UPI00310190FD